MGLPEAGESPEQEAPIVKMFRKLRVPALLESSKTLSQELGRCGQLRAGCGPCCLFFKQPGGTCVRNRSPDRGHRLGCQGPLAGGCPVPSGPWFPPLSVELFHAL